MSTSEFYYQFGGFRPHISWTILNRDVWTTYKEIANCVAGPDSPLRRHGLDTVEVFYGIKGSGSVHLLLDEHSASKFRRARLATYRHGERRDRFLSVSPWTVNQAELAEKLRTLAPKRQGKHNMEDSSQDNKIYRDLDAYRDNYNPLSEDRMSYARPGLARAMFEDSRLLWITREDPAYARRASIPRISRVCSLMINTSGLDKRYTTDRRETPRVVDIATSEADTKTWVPTSTTYKKLLGQKGHTVTGDRKAQPRVNDAVMCSDDELYGHIREFFSRPTSSATLLLVHDRNTLDTCRFIAKAGVDTRNWRNGVSQRPSPSPGSLHLWDQEMARSPRDDSQNNRRRRSRSRSPVRRGDSSHSSRRHRSRTPPTTARGAPVYVVSIKELMDQVERVNAAWETLGAIGERMGVQGCRSDEWCAANEAEAVFEIYRMFAAGPPIDILTKQLSDRASVPPAIASRPQVDVDAEDFDPNDLPADTEPVPAQRVQDSYINDEDDYGEDDDSD